MLTLLYAIARGGLGNGSHLHVQCKIIPGSICSALFSGYIRVCFAFVQLVLINRTTNGFLDLASTLVYTICWDPGTNLRRLASGQ